MTDQPFPARVPPLAKKAQSSSQKALGRQSQPVPQWETPLPFLWGHGFAVSGAEKKGRI